jgi:CAAX protease family protein
MSDLLPQPESRQRVDETQLGSGSQLSLWEKSKDPSERQVLAPASDVEAEVDSRVAPDSAPGSAPDQADLSTDPPWDIADLVRLVLFVVAAGLMTAVLTAIGYGLLRELFHWTEPAQVALTRVPVQLSMQMVAESLGVLFIYLTITVKYRREFWSAIRWVRPPERAFHFVLLGAGMAMALNWLSSYIPPDKQLPVEEWFADTSSAYAVALVGVLAAPFIEELFFRGFCYPVFERRWGMTAAVFLTGTLFATVHGFQLAWSWREVSVIFLVGVVLSYTRAKTRSLVPSYLMHVAYNSTIFVSVFVATDHFRKLQG